MCLKGVNRTVSAVVLTQLQPICSHTPIGRERALKMRKVRVRVSVGAFVMIHCPYGEIGIHGALKMRLFPVRVRVGVLTISQDLMRVIPANFYYL